MKITVVGGGPSGLSFSTSIKSFDVLVVEQHTPLKEPPHCTGLISFRAYKLLTETGRIGILGSYSKISVHSSDWSRVLLDFRKPIAFLIKRGDYISNLWCKLQSLGHKVIYGRVVGVDFRGKVLLKGREIYDSDIIILSEGAPQVLTRNLGLVETSDWIANTVLGLQQDFKVGGCIDTSTLHIFLNHKYAPNYYSWAIPYDEGRRLRVGLGGVRSVNLLKRLKYFVRDLERNFKLRLEPTSKPWGGLILTRGPSTRDHYSRIIRLGDSAFHVKPVSGGGLYTSRIFSTTLGETIDKLGDLSYSLREYYERTKSLRTSLRIQTFIGKVLHNSEDYLRCKSIKLVGDKAWDEKTLKLLDYDHHERVIYVATVKPSILPGGLYLLSSKKAIINAILTFPRLL